jgi:glycine/D-amino acid oxidase-like deaminating enzyme
MNKVALLEKELGQRTGLLPTTEKTRCTDDVKVSVGSMRDAGHAFVLGSGIAGLSISEILSRNGWRITLLESSAHLGGHASRATQNWLHTGWLYAALACDAAMRGCHRAIGLFHATYDSVLGPEVVNLQVNASGVSFPHSSTGWFSPERVQYIYALTTSELSIWQRLTWRHYLNLVPLRRLRALGYSTAPLQEISTNLRNLLDYWERADSGHRKYSVIPSTDAQINTRRVMNSLLMLLGDRADVVRGADYELVRQRDRSAIRIGGETHVPDLLVIASGASIPEQLQQLGRDTMANQFKSIRSPIVVLNRELELPSFIRFTPQLPTTVNHIKYIMDGVGTFSTLGSYEYYEAGQEPDISPFSDRICKRLNISSQDVLDRYYGTKTEFTGSAKRRYNHAVERVNDNTYFAIPGKFSQFPLMVHDFADRLGLRTDIVNDVRGVLALQVSPTHQERIAGAITAESLDPIASAASLARTLKRNHNAHPPDKASHNRVDEVSMTE